MRSLCQELPWWGHKDEGRQTEMEKEKLFQVYCLHKPMSVTGYTIRQGNRQAIQIRKPDIRQKIIWKSLRINCGTHTAVLHFLLRKTLLKKGSSSNSFPKTFSVKFCPYRALFTKVKTQSLLGAPYMGKINIKSLWKGVRGRTFPQKGMPR